MVKENGVSLENMFKDILIEADSNPFLKDITEIDKDKSREAIYYEGELAGFYTPRQVNYLGKLYWRTGAIYIKPEYRRKGIASGTIKSFYSDKPYGIAYIDPNNIASLATYEKCGFRKDKIVIGNRTKNKIWQMIKEPNDLKPAFLSW